MKSVRKMFNLFVLCVASSTLSLSVSAQDWPMVGGDYWEVASISLSDGGGLKYSRWLADEWRKNGEFAKKKGWIKDYFILSNVHARKGEADLYLIQVFESMPSGAEGEKRSVEYVEWKKKSVDDLVAESGNRAEYREVMGSSLLQELNFRQ